MIPSLADAKIILTHLLEIGVYALMIFGAILAFRCAFKSKAKPALRFGLWFLLLLRLTVPFTMASAIHLVVLPAAGSASAPATTETQASALPVRPAADPAASPRPATGSGVATAPSEKIREEWAALAPRPTIWQWLFIVWAVGAVAFLIRRLWMRGQLVLRLRDRGRKPDPGIAREFHGLCRRMHVQRRVRLLKMEDITSPALTIGPRPTILLPASLTAEDRKRDRRFALMHELTHLKRGDHLIMLWYGALRCVWWFHPVVWLMEKPFRMDMESACDAKAVVGMSREEKLAYAALLLELSGERNL